MIDRDEFDAWSESVITRGFFEWVEAWKTNYGNEWLEALDKSFVREEELSAKRTELRGALRMLSVIGTFKFEDLDGEPIGDQPD